MVFFTCNSCGSCIKKPAVEKHLYHCRSSSLSCMDCNKDFYGDAYRAHTKCVTELEKYSGEGWKAPAGHNKGEKKQNAWMDTVAATVEKAKSAPPAVKSLLHSLTRHDNVPRKKPKFLNFVKNIARNHFDNGTIETVWTLLEAQWKLEKEAQIQPQNGKPSMEDASDGNTPKTTESEAVAEETENIPKKKKKKHRVKPEVQETSDANGENNLQHEVQDNLDNPESTPAKKKSKKHKKKKAEEDNDAQPETKVEELLTEEPEEQPVKKSKKHKKRHVAAASDVEVAEEQNGQPMEADLEGETKISKKKKKVDGWRS